MNIIEKIENFLLEHSNTKSLFDLEKELKNGEPVKIDDDRVAVVVNINTKNFPDMSKEFVKQLKDEGKYNSFVSVVMFEKNYKFPYNWQLLPIFGEGNKYVTKWIYDSYTDCVKNLKREQKL